MNAEAMTKEIRRKRKEYRKAGKPEAGRNIRKAKERLIPADGRTDGECEENPAEEALAEGNKTAAGLAGAESSVVFGRNRKKRLQRRTIRETANRRKSTEFLTEAIESLQKAAKALGKNIVRETAKHPEMAAFAAGGLLLTALAASAVSSVSVVAEGLGGAAVGTSFTAKEGAILGAESQYAVLETSLQDTINEVETDHPGFEEYRIEAAEIFHDPFPLISYLTVKYEDFTEEEVLGEIGSLFAEQYELELTEKTEKKRREREKERTVKSVGEDGKEVQKKETYTETEEYECKILSVKLVNHTLEAVIEGKLCSEEERDRYQLLLTTGGNRGELFAGNPYAFSAAVLDYDIPGEALTDVRFSRMVNEGRKYLGKAYVWGGETPAAGFDCSGFVSWVCNHSGNGWHFGRLTAEGLRDVCRIIRNGEARPGDLVFFRGTYATNGASHVGIYVGDGMMLHCGNPIQFASFETEYWQGHFYCFGRLP